MRVERVKEKGIEKTEAKRGKQNADRGGKGRKRKKNV